MNMCLGCNFDNAQDLVRVLMLLLLPSLSSDFLFFLHHI